MKALLVEDDEMIGQSLVPALERAGWTVDWVRDGAPVALALRDGGYACVLLDLGLQYLFASEPTLFYKISTFCILNNQLDSAVVYY